MTRVTIAILALGGQGGGVLADWIVALAAANGWRAQGTSVPGVAQRTGSTVYYVEMMPPGGADPVFALMPVPGDVDIVLAAELMEAGRAILRGFVTHERTLLIGSTHRIYAISEKSAMGNGIAAGERILVAARERARRFIGFDMDEAGRRSGSMVSAVLFGALAASGELPFGRADFQAVIEGSGIATGTNQAGFAAGFDAAQPGASAAPAFLADPTAPEPTTAAGRELLVRAEAMLPVAALTNARHGLDRLCDYQDAGYALLYLDRLARIAALDDGADDYVLTVETARHLALWMSYDDVIRVAQLKLREGRIAHIRNDVAARPGEIARVYEYMHPRLREICDVLPAGVARRLLASPLVEWLTGPAFAKGRRVETTGLGWNLTLRTVAALRRFRTHGLRYDEEQERIDAWLDCAAASAQHDSRLATEIIRCQRLIKGYGDTFDHGLASFGRIMAALPQLTGDSNASDRLAAWREAALADDRGEALAAALSTPVARAVQAVGGSIQ